MKKNDRAESDLCKRKNEKTLALLVEVPAGYTVLFKNQHKKSAQIIFAG